MTVEQRVAKGVAWLDKHVPDWVDKVNLDEFDMEDACRCVLGGVFAKESAQAQEYSQSRCSGYVYALTRMVRGGYTRNGIWAQNHGFDSDGDFTALQREWERVINERRASKVVVVIRRQRRVITRRNESRRAERRAKMGVETAP